MSAWEPAGSAEATVAAGLAEWKEIEGVGRVLIAIPPSRKSEMRLSKEYILPDKLRAEFAKAMFHGGDASFGLTLINSRPPTAVSISIEVSYFDASGTLLGEILGFELGQETSKDGITGDDVRSLDDTKH